MSRGSLWLQAFHPPLPDPLPAGRGNPDRQAVHNPARCPTTPIFEGGREDHGGENGRSTRSAQCRGFSTLEVLVGLALFAVVAAGLAVASVGATRANSTSNSISVASALIYDKIEQLRALDPSANPADIAPGEHADAANPMTPLGMPGGQFTRTWLITPNTPRAGLSEAVVTVTWSESAPRGARGVTYICSSASCS